MLNDRKRNYALVLIPVPSCLSLPLSQADHPTCRALQPPSAAPHRSFSLVLVKFGLVFTTPPPPRVVCF